MRARISNGRHLSSFFNCFDTLDELYEELKSRSELTKTEQALFTTRIAAIKTKLDAYLKILGKEHDQHEADKVNSSQSMSLNS